ncbi:hypothetical protein [Microbacterium sp. RU33B]|uniref:hypothetical protein n=1 Tax=Microbacterium sp. RU33B TaxID=1907390 RepID=UPI00095AF71C|nr:hypothetical protein [Microbacterium sp. RU33B]SIT84228.1 hypothetical protein SAMN05880545_2163 [Microbacterium sp. RU33B]
MTRLHGPRGDRSEARPELPAWPIAWLFVGYPVWWILGLGEAAWILAAAAMAYFIAKTGRRLVPIGFGLVLALLMWIALSGVAIDSFGRLLGFAFRFAQYASFAVLFVYVYNARPTVSLNRLLAYLTAFWGWIIVGGYLALAFPTAVIRTPLSYVLPDSLLGNDLIQQMVVRRLTQFNPEAWAYIDPRPSAPFLYTNNWGNAYSLLLPLVLLLITRMPAGWRRWGLIVAVPVSAVPAFLTLNRGMFIGLGVVAFVIAVRLALQGRTRAVLGLAGLGGAGLLLVWLLPVADRLSNRLEISGTNDDRLGVYFETIARTATSPLFGFGAPRPAEASSGFAPPVGTQGQIWMVLFSHGYIGLLLFISVLVWMTVRAFKWPDLAGIVASGVLCALLVEVFYYGVLGAGLAIAFVLGALAMREWPLSPPDELTNVLRDPIAHGSTRSRVNGDDARAIA